MDKKTWIIIGVLIAAFAGLVGVSIAQNSIPQAELSSVHAPSADNGNFGEMIDGDPDAPVKIYEYGDYQCDACAPMNPYINEIIEEYDGKVAVVFRTMIMSYHANGTAAASAALAAARQGYWKEYKDLLYKNQNDWFYSDALQRQKQFEEYFKQVSDGKGDLDKFLEDMGSSEVSQKISFDANLANKQKVSFTPTFYVEGDFVDQRGNNPDGTKKTRDDFLKELRAKIDEKLAEKGIEK